MNPFELAKTLGYGKNDILKFLQKASPEINEALTKATQVGYTTEQVFDFLSKSLAGVKVDPKVQRQVFGSPNEASVMKRAQNVKEDRRSAPLGVSGGLAGAAVGGLVGGIPGAIVGGVTGFNELNKLTKAYEQHVQSGGSIPFEQFVISLAKGGVKAGIASAGAEQLQQAAIDYIKSNLPKEEEQQQAPTGEPTEPEPQAPGQVQEPEVEEKQQTIKETQEIEEPVIEGDRGLFEKLIENKDPTQLSEDRKSSLNFYKTIANKLEQQGKDVNSPESRQLKKKIDKLFTQKPTLLEEEKERFQQSYPDIEEKTGKKWSQVENPRGFSFNNLIGDVSEKAKSIEGRIQPFESAMKSSNLSAATFDPDTEKMRILFRAKEGGKGGNVYEYENMDKETFDKMTGGEAKPITEGSNKFGVWFNTKNPSIGATFSKFIKKNPEQFPYKKVEPEGYSLEEKQIVQADRAHLASELFEPFAKERKEGRQRARAQGLKDIVPALKNMDDDFLFDVVSYLESKLKNKLKTEPKVKRLAKEFEKEFQR